MIVKVTQYMRPNGRQVEHELVINDACKEKYEEMKDCGFRLAAEQLMPGTVSQTVEGSGFDFDIIITDGSDLQENKQKLEEMILRFDKDAALDEIKKFQEI